MKKLIICSILLLCLACSNDDNTSNCNFLFDATVNLTINTNLPQFNQLQFPGNGVYVSGQGNNGIWLWSLNSTTLLAWDASDPSRQPSACSRLVDIGGGFVASTCEDENQYILATGQGIEGNTLPCTLKPYRVDNLGGGQYLVTNN